MVTTLLAWFTDHGCPNTLDREVVKKAKMHTNVRSFFLTHLVPEVAVKETKGRSEPELESFDPEDFSLF